MKKSEKDLKKYEMKICNTVTAIDENVRDRFKALAHISDKLADLSKKYEEEAKQIEYEALNADKPLFKYRTMIIQGEDVSEIDITTEEFDKRAEEIKDEEYEKIKIKEFKDVSNLVNHKGIPGFWLTAMKFNRIMGTQIEKKDEKLLREMYDIEYIKQEDSSDFVLKFHFNTNDYMQNTVITKRYIMEDDDKVKKIDCTKVKWRSGMNLMEKEQQSKKPKGKKKKKAKEEDEFPEESFFRFFESKDACKMSPEEDDLDSEDEMRLDALEEDFDIAAEFKDELIPNALEYYLNIAEEEPIEEAEGEEDDEGHAGPDGQNIVDGKEVDDDSQGSIDD